MAEQQAKVVYLVDGNKESILIPKGDSRAVLHKPDNEYEGVEQTTVSAELDKQVALINQEIADRGTAVAGEASARTNADSGLDAKITSHTSNKANPHGVTKAQVGLGSVANTGDSATPVSGGATKFTTGGAYTELAKKLNVAGDNGTAAGVSALVNKLGAATSDPQDADYYVAQYAGGGTTTTSYHRRPHSALWSYIKGKISSVLGLTASAYSGKASTAGNADKATNDARGQKIDTTYIKEISATGKTLTIKKGDGTTDTVTTQDTITTIDTALSATSANPVQNKVVKAALDGKAASSHKHALADITGIASASVAHADTAGSATKATQDANGNVIADTYAAKDNLLSALVNSDGGLSVTVADIVKTVEALNAHTVDGYHAGTSDGMLCPIVASNFGSSSGYVKWGNGLLIQWTSKYNNAQYFYINWPVGFSSADYIVVDAAWAVSGDRLPEEFVMAREVSRIKICNDTWNERDARTFVIGIGT